MASVSPTRGNWGSIGATKTLVVGACIAILAVIPSVSLPLQIVSAVALTVIVVSPHRNDFLHPLLWFPPAFLFYSASYPTLIALGYYAEDRTATQLIPLCITALTGFTLGAGIRTTRYGGPPVAAPTAARLEKAARLLSIPLVAITSAVVLYALRGGMTTKQELVAARASSVILRLDVAYLFLTLTLTVTLIARWQRGLKSGRLIAIALLWFGIGYSVLGERDLLFRFLLVVLLAGWEVRRAVRPWVVYSVSLLVLALLPASQSLKGWLIGSGSELRYDTYSLLGGEFRSAGQNLHVILDLDLPKVHGETLIWDLKRTFSSQVFGSEAHSPAEWFNTEILPDLGYGRGFSLVAEGYMNFGMAGVAAFYLFLGFVTSALYQRRSRGVLWYSAYLLFIPLVLYVQRADLANLLSQGLKTVFMPCLAVWFVAELLRRGAPLQSHKMISSAGAAPSTGPFNAQNGRRSD